MEDPEAVAEPFIENLEAKSRETYYQIDCRTAGGIEVILVAVAEEADRVVVEEAFVESLAEVILEADAESNCLLKLAAKKLTKLYLRLTPSRIAC